MFSSAVPRTVEQVLTSFPRKRATQPRVNCHMLLSRDHVSSAFRGHNLCIGLQPDPQRSSRGGRRQTRVEPGFINILKDLKKTNVPSLALYASQLTSQVAQPDRILR